ncbi:FAD-binding protein [soil metagenome]
MRKQLQLRLSPEENAAEHIVMRKCAQAIGVSPNRVTGIRRMRESIDARGRNIMIQLMVEAVVDEPYSPENFVTPEVLDVRKAKPVLIIGSGPAGLFAAIRLIELGLKPIIIERGKDVRSRRRDLATINKQGEVNAESNYCFGEGGAGTYSDGKLYTRSTKRGDVQRILDLFTRFGADSSINYHAHPHIGTNKLPQIISAMRQYIEDCGGEVHFNTKLTEILVDGDQITGITCADGQHFKADALILATGHSARDVFELMHGMGLEIEAKPFALGVRIEHPQDIIDSIQYHCDTRNELLPAASYSLVHQAQGRGVFSFCMCPGGIIAPASTNPGEIVVNGWSPSKRNNPYANSGMVVSVGGDDFKEYERFGPLAGMYYQAEVEQKAFVAGGGKLKAPAQRVTDFIRGKVSTSLPDCSYFPGLTSYNLREVLPAEVHTRLGEGLEAFGKKMRGYVTEHAVLVGVESRTSTPVRIPRNELLQHPQLKGLYPCGEGAGYAGGIMSAAMDGERCAEAVAFSIKI